jgi:hypothetical protein
MSEQKALLTPEGLARSMCQDLGLEPPFRARHFAQAAERRWHVKLMLEPCPSGDYATGWCVLHGAAYTIYYYDGGSVVQRERILFHELCHIVMGHVRGTFPAGVMRKSRNSLGQEAAVEEVAKALVAYAMLGDPPTEHLHQKVPPLSAYGNFIDSILAK